jgi:hypothetical protein
MLLFNVSFIIGERGSFACLCLILVLQGVIGVIKGYENNVVAFHYAKT